MAFVVRRPAGRFEIRESRATAAGPRATTLAAFRELSDDVLDRAEARSGAGFERAEVEARALALGARRADGTAPEAARHLLARLRGGAGLPPALREAVREALGPPRDLPDSIPPALRWIGASDEERGQALRELLRLTDRLPPTGRRHEGLRFPPLRPTRDG